MSEEQHGDGCRELRFSHKIEVTETAEVALEDYAREVSGGKDAHAVREGDGGGRVQGVHLCGLGEDLPQAKAEDIEGFAKSLEAPSAGLGWS